MLVEEQGGNYKGRSCNDADFSLKRLCELTSKAGLTDLSNPYNHVDSHLQLKMLGSYLGYFDRTLQPITDLHVETMYTMQADKHNPDSWFHLPLASSKAM